MRDCLIGYTGFVGSNILKKMSFTDLYNSKNISEIKGKKYDMIVCAGIRAEKYLANKYPEDDLAAIKGLISDLETVACSRFVLISTIDVYDNPKGADEDTEINESNLHPYGLNRLYMEKWVKSKFDNYTIIRLPALFGEGLKKNFIYDCITKIPTMIIQSKYIELSENSTYIKQCYIQDDKGNYHFDKNTDENTRIKLIKELETLGFTSLVFTDSRSVFPFYYLDEVCRHIQIAIDNNIDLINFAAQPVSAKEVAKKVFDIDFENVNPNKEPADYDIKSKHYKLFNGNDGYIVDKSTVIKQIQQFVGDKV